MTRQAREEAMTGYVLYGWKLTGSLAIEAALAEASVPFDLVPINTKAREHQTEAFARLNPRLQLPVLRLPDGSCIAEGPAILNHIADAFPAARLAPPPGSSDRAHHDRWLAFFHANVYEGELRKLFPNRYVDDEAAAASVKRAAEAYVERHYRIFEAAIVDGPFFLGDNLSVLDIYVWMLAQWMDRPWLAANCPQVLNLADDVAARPKIAPVHAFHFGPAA
jgi:glutathione S-transferase